jgi:SAM-dependent methyltransferase
MEAMPFEQAAFDLIWCRDMLCHMRGLVEGMRECARVLKPGGWIILVALHQTDLMEPREAARLYPPLKVVPASMSRPNIERAFEEAGLHVVTGETIGSELLEYYEEQDGRVSRELMRIARMLRAREKFVSQLGETAYTIALALYHWHVYQMLGKLTMTVDVLQHSSRGEHSMRTD